MDYFGSVFAFILNIFLFGVSILLGQWITLEDLSKTSTFQFFNRFNPSGSMDYFGSFCCIRRIIEDFWVSILLGQWITLEVKKTRVATLTIYSFNPSGSMDYFGRVRIKKICMEMCKFQSFWVNGLLWKTRANQIRKYYWWFQSFWVNGLLWKNAASIPTELLFRCFNPSGSMDYFGSADTVYINAAYRRFQSFWVNGLLWKLLPSHLVCLT